MIAPMITSRDPETAANKKIVFRKAVELHHKLGGGHPEISAGRIASELNLTTEETSIHLNSLSALRLVKFKENKDSIEVTRVGLSTTMG